MQSIIGNVASGSVFATFQSIGAAGIGAVATGIMQTAGAFSAFAAGLFVWME